MPTSSSPLESVLKTKSIQQGYVALSVFDSDSNDLDMLIGDMCATIEGVVSIETTYACRDAQINGISIKKDEYINIENTITSLIGEGVNN